MLQLSITVTGLDRKIANLASFGKGLDDMRRAFREIAQNEASYFANKAFNSRGGVFRRRWPALTESYARTKRRMWGNKPVLVASGNMSNSFYGEYSNRSATMGNISPQFKYHQSNRPRRVLPRRQMVGVNSKVKEIARLPIEKELRRRMRNI